MSPRRILLCADLDRTLIPNGAHPESPAARPLLNRIAAHPELVLAYVSGRHLGLLQEAIAHYALPAPHYAIGDVGTSMYTLEDGRWRPLEAWQADIAPDWAGHTHADIAALFHDLTPLTLQEAQRQNRFKVSYFTPLDVDHGALCAALQQRLAARGVRASLIWSIDEARGVGLLDILPERATKLHAVRFLMERTGFDATHTVFGGDSGNDLPVLVSGLQCVLVRNAAPELREQAVAELRRSGLPQRLYLAQGGLLGMNGNYAAGVLEGLVHFFPETARWMQAASAVR